MTDRYKRPVSVLIVIYAESAGDYAPATVPTSFPQQVSNQSIPQPAATLNQPPYILLLERAKNPGYWQSVTGSLEDDETPVQAACRELAEETGIVVDESELCDWHLQNRFLILDLWRQRYHPDVSHNLEHVFSLRLGQTCAITPAAAEHSAWRWLPREQAAAACFSWSNRDAILMLPINAAISAAKKSERLN